MLKRLTISLISLFIFPAISLAAFNDTTLTTDTVIQVGSYTLNVSGTSAVLQSITVNEDDFSVTLGSGSSITISSPTLNTLTPSSQTGVTSNICTASVSSLTLSYSGAGTITNTITPSATICTDPAPVTPPTPPTTHTSSGGGMASPATLAALGLIPKELPVVPGCPQGYVCKLRTGSTATDANIPMNTVNTNGTTPIITPTTFTRNLEVGKIGQDVKFLQQFLNSHGYTIAVTGAGSPGHETTTFGLLTKKALTKYQKDHKISATGFFGPMTRGMVGR